MAGALKNVFAIAVGMGYSLGIGENTRALVIARALREMPRLGVAMGGHRDTFAGLAGMGDLIVTCTSQQQPQPPRRRAAGRGQNDRRDHRVDEPVAEGVKAASVIMEFADEYGSSMPIAREVDGVINQTAPSRTPTAGWSAASGAEHDAWIAREALHKVSPEPK